MVANKPRKRLPNTLIIIVVILILIIYYLDQQKNTDQGFTKQQTETNFISPKNSDTNQLVVMFYNLENLFDTIDDPKNRYDNEFTPNGEKHWNSQRYIKKLKNIGQVLTNINSKELPDLIGVCEIENNKVLNDLLKFNNLQNYKYIHFESKDIRGIDLALIYNPAEFQPINAQKIDIYYRENRPARTREILYITGITRNRDTLHIFLNHWKSRVSRKKGETDEYKRIAAAKILRKHVDKILKQNPNAKIIIMGDFNDEPTNLSLYKYLKAKDKISKKGELYNAMFFLDQNGQGTYYYKHNWLMFDNIILSKSILDTTDKIDLLTPYGSILKKDFLLTYDERYDDYVPFRTYIGDKYLGGYSDHLPVYIVLKVEY